MMLWSNVILGLQLAVLLKLCSALELVGSKRLQKCQEYSAQVYGNDEPRCQTSPAAPGYVASLKDFPHNAILGYYNEDRPEYITWYGIGTLVSSRYILTVAQYRLQNSHPVKVRLGVLASAVSDQPNTSDYDIEHIIMHPDYIPQSSYNDIALIKLARVVHFSENVRPICLPDSDLMSSTVYQANYQFDLIFNSDIMPLIKFELNSVTTEVCNETYYPSLTNQIFHNGITDQLMCNGVTAYQTDFCYGTPGAAIYITHPQVACSNLQLGCSVFGFNCDGFQPDVALRVFNFSDWIENIIWADDEDN